MTQRNLQVGNRAAGQNAIRRRQLGPAIPAEGEDGCFSETWFPICLSRDLAPEKIFGTDFLGGRVIAVRGPCGEARVMSAFCAHLGADLSVGEMVDNSIRCAFHHWCYDFNGVCISTKVGDPPPPNARLFSFPTTERYGIVWAYNGESPRFAVPQFPYPEADLTLKTSVVPETFPVDPWVLSCNTPDMQHIKALHGFTFEHGDPHDDVEWTDHSMLYDFRGRAQGQAIAYRVGIFGTNIFYQSSTVNGRWFGVMTPFGLPRPQETKVFFVLAARRSDGDDHSTAEFLHFVTDLEMRILSEDIPVLRTIHFRPGALTSSDRTLAKFLQYLRDFSRCHPSAEFIV